MTILYDMIIKSQNGDKKSLMEIIKKFNPIIKKYSRKLSYDGADSDLIISLIETIFFLPILNNSNLKKDEYIVGYISTSVKNKYINLAKKNTKISINETELNLDFITNKMIFSAEDNIFIKDLLDRLTKLQKKVIILKFFNGYTDNEIACNLHISRQSVNRTKNRALKKLRKEIGDE